MTVNQVADHYQVAPRTVRRWIASAKLPAKKLPGGDVRISRSDMLALATPAAAEVPS